MQQLFLVLGKCFFMMLFFVIVLVFGTLPIRAKKFKKNPFLLSMGSTFAGCLFINVALMHILPQAVQTLNFKINDNQDSDSFPLAFLLMMVGFIITVFFTKVFSFHSHGQQENHQNNHQHHHHHHQHNHQHSDFNQKKQSLLSQNQKQQVQIIQSYGQTSQINSKTQLDNLQQPLDKKTLSSALVLTIAIYFHTIFQGIAVGIQSDIGSFLGTSVAIALHKWADALSMGCHYKTNKLPKKFSYGLIIGQAILNVISIGVGWLISSQGQVVQAVFLSISSGTFLAISTLQLLSQQFHSRKHIWIKFGLLIFSTIFIVGVWFTQNAIFG